MSPAATVLITTRNEEKNIGPCLASVRAQGLSPGELEILVVDNSSNDRTAEIARSGGARVLERGPERSAQRNLGLAEARGEFVLILDADMRLGAGVIAEGLSRFEHDGAAAL
nr:glycosyltransferase [bacterium]